MGAMEIIQSWSFLSPKQVTAVQEIQLLLIGEDWIDAVRKNEDLMNQMPEAIFKAGGMLPLVDIRPAGDKSPPKTQKRLDGWQWRLSIGWLATYALDFPGAHRRFLRVHVEGPAVWTKDAEMASSEALIRQGRLAEGRRILIKHKALQKEDELILTLALDGSASSRVQLHSLAMDGRPKLSGVIGGQAIEEPENRMSSKGRMHAAMLLGEISWRENNKDLAKTYFTKAAELSAGSWSHRARIARAQKAFIEKPQKPPTR